MRLGLKVDPRTAKSFKDFGLKDALIRAIPQNINEPLPVQKKMLALNTSGISAFVESAPKQGKSTAAILGLLATPKLPPPHITNLVLVPTPALADQYKEVMDKLGISNPQHFQVLYRTGSEEADEEQHMKITGSHETTHLHTLIATPQRVLDYLSVDPKLLNLYNISQLVIDELDVFAPSNSASGKLTPLETLVGHILDVRDKEARDPIIQILTSARASFGKLPHTLAKCKRPLIEVVEHTNPWSGEVVGSPQNSRNFTGVNVQGCVSALKRAWRGPGLVVPPGGMSPMKLQDAIGSSLDGAVVVKPQETAGLNIDGLENVYIMGPLCESDVDRVKWMSARLIYV